MIIQIIKEKYGEGVHIVSIQEFFIGRWVKPISQKLETQISEAENAGATVVSFYIKIENYNEEDKKNEIVDIYPDVRI